MEKGRAFYEKYSAVNEKFTKLGQHLKNLRSKSGSHTPIKGFASLDKIEGSDPFMVKFEANFSGIINSFIFRFPYSEKMTT